MKKFGQLVVFVGVFFISASVFSQDVSEASESVKKIAKVGTDRWKNTLILNTIQVKQLLDLTTVYEMKKSEIFKADGLSAEEMNSKLVALETSHHKLVEEILNDKQKEKYRSKLKLIQG